MARHRMPTSGRHRASRRQARRRSTPLLAAGLLAPGLLVAVPAGQAVAEPGAGPPPLVDTAGTAVGGLLGTGGEVPGVPAATGAGDVVDVAGAATASGGTAVEDGRSDGTGDDRSEAGESAAADGTHVTLAEKNGSGVSGEALVDSAQVAATASGLDPDARYVSFFYGATSSASNNNPCILDGTNPLPGDQTVGEWDVDPDGTGTLRAANPLGARYTLQAGTMSIRKVEHDFSTATALPVNPASYSLVACGEVERLEILDPVTDLAPSLPKLPSLPPLS